MKATITVSVTTGFDIREAAAVEIDGPFLQAFAPMDRVDEPLAVLFGRGAKLESSVLVVMRRREKFASILATALTKQIVETMEARDKVNGYPIEEMRDHVLARMSPTSTTDANG